MRWALFLALLWTGILLGSRQALCSYLDVPRIHFTGTFRADVNTRNNWQCNFDVKNKLYPPQEWNYNGTNEFELIDTVVTAVVDGEGNKVPASPLLGASVLTNTKRPFGKTVDIDVDFQVTSLFGLRLSLEKDGELLVEGEWTRAVIVHDMWKIYHCLPEEHSSFSHSSSAFGVQSTTRITGLKWSPSDTIKSLKDATGEGELSVSISLRGYKKDVFIIGEVIGTIGIAKAGEPLNVGGERRLETADPGKINFPPDHPCHGFIQTEQKPWTYGAPFKVDETRGTMVVDLSNALPVLYNEYPVNFGSMWFGVLDGNNVVQPFGEQIPYLGGDMWKEGGVVERAIGSETLGQLVVFIHPFDSDPDAQTVHLGGTFSSSHDGVETVQLLLQETEYFIRPLDYYMDRVEYKDTSAMTLLVTRFGEPADGVDITVKSTYNQQSLTCLPAPHDAISVDENTKQTESGLVTFNFEVAKEIPLERLYFTENCKQEDEDCNCPPGNDETCTKPAYTLPIDGQLYNFLYCVGKECDTPSDSLFLYRALLTFYAYSTVQYSSEPTWVDDVKPIFEQYHHLTNIMRTVLDMSNFTDVTLPYNINLLKLAMSKDILDPNYMPTTRDLSPTKRSMILKWLDNPRYSKTSQHDPRASHFIPLCKPLPTSRLRGATKPDYTKPPRCLKDHISLETNPEEDEKYFRKVFDSPNQEMVLSDFSNGISNADSRSERPLFGVGNALETAYTQQGFDDLNEGILGSNTSNTTIRPLFGVGDNLEDFKEEHEEDAGYFLNICPSPLFPKCTLDNVKQQLQLAVQLEFSTLPLYLTSLYSIMDNCNTEAYTTIREVVIQEMLHLAQAANILISIGGTVNIDDPDVVPKYPTVGLPGNVLPNLHVELKKFQINHMFENLMAIETPTLTNVSDHDMEFKLHTIGAFYDEVKLCMWCLGSNIEYQTLDEAQRSQVQWPWPLGENIGKLYTVTDLKSAKTGINQIVHQGEGANPFSPNDHITGQYAHFFRFEEIVCQRRLIKTQDDGYAFKGAPIPYNAAGVWPMRDNPRSKDIKPGTECYTEAKAFQRAYRNFLRVMQETFNGSPEKITLAVELMEALQVHAKKTMWTLFDEATTCGPIWEYTWEEHSSA